MSGRTSLLQPTDMDLLVCAHGFRAISRGFILVFCFPWIGWLFITYGLCRISRWNKRTYLLIALTLLLMPAAGLAWLGGYANLPGIGSLRTAVISPVILLHLLLAWGCARVAGDFSTLLTGGTQQKESRFGRWVFLVSFLVFALVLWSGRQFGYLDATPHPLFMALCIGAGSVFMFSYGVIIISLLEVSNLCETKQEELPKTPSLQKGEFS